MSRRVSAADRAESIATLREILRPGDTVTTVLRHRSASGMYRAVDLFAMTAERGEVSRRWLSYHAARAGVGRWDDRRESVGMTGAGMDMGFAAVYALGSILWPDGFRCAGKRCRANDHWNAPYPPRDGRRHHRDGGYALRQEWL